MVSGAITRVILLFAIAEQERMTIPGGIPASDHITERGEAFNIDTAQPVSFRRHARCYNAQAAPPSDDLGNRVVIALAIAASAFLRSAPVSLGLFVIFRLVARIQPHPLDEADDRIAGETVSFQP